MAEGFRRRTFQKCDIFASMKIGPLHPELKKDVCTQGSIEGLKDLR